MKRCVVLFLITGALLAACGGSGLATPGRMLFMGCNPLYQGPALYVADPDGGDVMRVMTPPGTTWYGSQGCGAWPDLSADGRWVAFSSEDGLAVWEIDLALLGWTEEWNLPQVIWPGAAHGPKWSPSGGRIAFGVSGVGLHVVDADGSNLRLLASAERAAPSWAPDESSIIFSTSIEIGAASGDLYLVTNIDGPGDPVVTQLTSTMDVGERVPKVSPDGLTVAYASGPVAAEGPAPSSVILADYPTLTNPQVLTSEADCMDVPQGWTPDGQYIYFTRAELVTGPSESLVASSWRLWRVKADGSELAELVPGLEDWDGGIWSGVTFLKQGVHGSAAYTLPGYTNVPLSIAAVGVENLAGLQTDLRFKDCCNIFDTMDTCAKGAMIDHWAMVTPSFDQVAGTVDVIAYAANPELDKVSGTGYLLNLTASMAMYEDLWWDQGTSPVFFAGVKLSDDWGEPIDMPVITGGLTLKPFSYLELSAVPAQVMADEVDPEPFSLTITARGDADELLPWVAKQVELFVEMPTDPDYPIWDWWIYNDIITPTSVALVDGTWTGDVSILGPVNPPARILARYEDWGGRSNDFTTLAKGDINADGVIDIFDVVKVANMAIGRGTWTDAELWAGDLNGDDVIDVLDVTLCADEAMGAMTATALIGGALAEQPEPVVVTTSAEKGKTQTVLSVELSDCTGLAGIQVEIAYDANKLSYSGMAAGELLAGTSSWALLDNDTGGTVKAIAYTPSRETLGGGQGTILAFAFDAVGRGSGSVELTSVKLSAPGGVEIASQIGPGKGGDKGKGGGKPPK